MLHLDNPLQKEKSILFTCLDVNVSGLSIDQHKCVPADLRLWGLSTSATKVRIEQTKIKWSWKLA